MTCMKTSVHTHLVQKLLVTSEEQLLLFHPFGVLWERENVWTTATERIISSHADVSVKHWVGQFVKIFYLSFYGKLFFQVFNLSFIPLNICLELLVGLQFNRTHQHIRYKKRTWISSYEQCVQNCVVTIHNGIVLLCDCYSTTLSVWFREHTNSWHVKLLKKRDAASRHTVLQDGQTMSSLFYSYGPDSTSGMYSLWEEFQEPWPPLQHPVRLRYAPAGWRKLSEEPDTPESTAWSASQTLQLPSPAEQHVNMINASNRIQSNKHHAHQTCKLTSSKSSSGVAGVRSMRREATEEVSESIDSSSYP